MHQEIRRKKIGQLRYVNTKLVREGRVTLPVASNTTTLHLLHGRVVVCYNQLIDVRYWRADKQSMPQWSVTLSSISKHCQAG